MLLGLIWYGLLMCYSIYSVLPEIAAAMLIVGVFIVPYIFAIFSYKYIKISTEHIQKNTNLLYVIVDRVGSNNLPSWNREEMSILLRRPFFTYKELIHLCHNIYQWLFSDWTAT